jgi:hypothetical protein
LWWGRWDLNPGSLAPQASILIHARRRPQSTRRRPNQSKVINTLNKLKGSDLAKDYWKIKTAVHLAFLYIYGGYRPKER